MGIMVSSLLIMGNAGCISSTVISRIRGGSKYSRPRGFQGFPVKGSGIRDALNQGCRTASAVELTAWGLLSFNCSTGDLYGAFLGIGDLYGAFFRIFWGFGTDYTIIWLMVLGLTFKAQVRGCSVGD